MGNTDRTMGRIEKLLDVGSIYFAKLTRANSLSAHGPLVHDSSLFRRPLIQGDDPVPLPGAILELHIVYSADVDKPHRYN